MLIFTNPNKRCCLCRGREVITVDSGVRTTSLKEVDGKFYCKDERECKQNRDAESTFYMFSVDEKGNMELTYYENGEEKLKVSKDGSSIF